MCLCAWRSTLWTDPSYLRRRAWVQCSAGVAGFLAARGLATQRCVTLRGLAGHLGCRKPARVLEVLSGSNESQTVLSYWSIAAPSESSVWFSCHLFSVPKAQTGINHKGRNDKVSVNNR